jgi:hypothetical protein
MHHTDEGGAGVDTSSMSTALAPPGGGGGSRKKNIKLSQMMKDYALAWVSLAPDDMELLHRYVCRFAVVYICHVVLKFMSARVMYALILGLFLILISTGISAKLCNTDSSLRKRATRRD